MSALAVFGLKYPSLLQFDETYEEATIRHNLKTLYKVNKAPSDTYMRKVLDEIDPQLIRPAFTALFSLLQRGKVLEDYKVLGRYIVIACDGTGMFSSHDVHCNNCCKKNHKNGDITYYHQMLGVVAIKYNQKEVFPLCPEPISKIDGETKNDCEQNAMRRVLKDFKEEHPHLETIFTEDALGAKGPYLKRIKDIGSHFVVNVNRNGNPSLFKWIKGICLEEKIVKEENDTIELKFCNGIPLNESNYDFEVNFIDCVVTDKKGKKVHFSWVTDLSVDQLNVHELAKIGRSRWRIENQTFNTLKNQGYHFNHNFGHGYKNLSHVFGLLMFLAFLIDQIQQRCCSLFQKAVKRAKRKIRYWERLRNVFLEFYVDSWANLYTHIADGQGIRLEELKDTS